MTDRYAVIGNPIGHSKSPLIHSRFAVATGQDMEYAALEAPPGGFASAVDAFRRAGGRGLNVTTPFKLDALAYATDLRPAARLAGAANALKFEGTRILAENFDGVGLLRDIRDNLRCPLAGRRVLILGAGGSTRGAILPFLAERPAALVIANRSADKAEALAAQFAPEGPVAAATEAALAAAAPFDLVVNATSASMRGECPPVPVGCFAAGCLAYDLVYGRGLTPFLRAARAAGSGRVADGVGMLVEQAAEAFAWWRGLRPDTAPLIEMLSVPLLPCAGA